MSQNEQIIHEGSRFSVVRRDHSVPGHGTLSREFIVHPGAVTIVPVLDDGRVCLIRNHRVAVGRQLMELPAGTLEQGEDPLAAAHRELAEETGYRAGRIQKLHEFYMSPGIMDERMYLFVATELIEGATCLEVGEEIEVCPTRWDDAMAMAMDGRIEDAKTLVGLLIWDRLRNR